MGCKSETASPERRQGRPGIAASTRLTLSCTSSAMGLNPPVHRWTKRPSASTRKVPGGRRGRTFPRFPGRVVIDGEVDAHFAEKFDDRLARPAVVHAHPHDPEALVGVLVVQLLEFGHLVPAGSAPGGPDVEHVGSARQAGRRRTRRRPGSRRRRRAPCRRARGVCRAFCTQPTPRLRSTRSGFSSRDPPLRLDFRNTWPQATQRGAGRPTARERRRGRAAAARATPRRGGRRTCGNPGTGSGRRIRVREPEPPGAPARKEPRSFLRRDCET